MNCFQPEEIESRLHAAYYKLLADDLVLLELDVNERSLTHKLAEYLQAEFPAWHVDCEYNRKGNVPKRLTRQVSLAPSNDTDGKTVFPDIIIHHRSTTENLVVIEAKKSSTAGSSGDVEKLRAYINEYGYRFAFAIIFPVGQRASEAHALADITPIYNDSER